MQTHTDTVTPVLNEADRIKDYRATAKLAVEGAKKQATWAREHADHAKIVLTQMRRFATLADKAANMAWDYSVLAQFACDRAYTEGAEEKYILGACRSATRYHHLAGNAQRRASKYNGQAIECRKNLRLAEEAGV